MSEYIDPVVYWSACSSLGLPEMELEVPVKTTGRIEIYKVPVCDTHPEGYFVALNTNTSWYANVEPGCAAWEKVLLARLLVNDPTKSDDEESHSGSTGNVVEYIHPDLANLFDYARFDPNSSNSAGATTAMDTTADSTEE